MLKPLASAFGPYPVAPVQCKPPYQHSIVADDKRYDVRMEDIKWRHVVVGSVVMLQFYATWTVVRITSVHAVANIDVLFKCYDWHALLPDAASEADARSIIEHLYPATAGDKGYVVWGVVALQYKRGKDAAVEMTTAGAKELLARIPTEEMGRSSARQSKEKEEKAQALEAKAQAKTQASDAKAQATKRQEAEQEAKGQLIGSIASAAKPSRMLVEVTTPQSPIKARPHKARRMEDEEKHAGEGEGASDDSDTPLAEQQRQRERERSGKYREREPSNEGGGKDREREPSKGEMASGKEGGGKGSKPSRKRTRNGDDEDLEEWTPEGWGATNRQLVSARAHTPHTLHSNPTHT